MLIRITREHDGYYVEVKGSDDADADEVTTYLKGTLVAFGFHPDTVKEMFAEK